MIHLLFTGGTISMQRDAAAGGNIPPTAARRWWRWRRESIGSPAHIEDWAACPPAT
jgi:hypothetical protein